MYWNFKIDVRLVILLLGGWAKHFIVTVNPDDFLHVKIPFSFYCKKMFAWSILLQNGTSVFPGSFYIDFIGHVILDQRILRNFKEYSGISKEL